ncbi:MAG TPA: hypothetical protein VJZ69_01630 [Clostridia bacterium]|nr:hypothetical protein [Clostridia bacterium]
MNINAVFKFLLAFLGAFYEQGLARIFWGVIGIFNYKEYKDALQSATVGFGAGEWAISSIFIILIAAILGAIVWFVVFLLRKMIRIRKNSVLPQDLVEECANLKHQIVKMSAEKDRILGMRVSSIGFQDGEEEGEEKKAKEGESRFYKLTEIDVLYENYVEPVYDDEITLSEFCDRFRFFACNRMKLFYEPRVIRLFVSGMATTRLLILQGISGTGKTSLPHAFGIFLNNPATIASVQPSWRDRTELFGYFNEFTKRFNETEVLKKMYEATWNRNIYLTILDEMNIARVEYYFAEMLSILEMPSRDEWVIDLVPSGWPSDPKHIVKGRFRLPANMWFIGTANNDDSTFAISDKVYDRAIPININSKGVGFEAPYTENLFISFDHLESMFKTAQQENKVSEDNLKKINDLDDFVIKHFRLAFGNRIVKQLKEFVPCYIACGGTELDGLDYVLCNKILRKFESLNLAYIRDEIDGLVLYLSEQFGEENMIECKDYLNRLKKLF